MATISLADLLNLSVSERIQLVQDLWDSIAADSESPPPTAVQLQELDRRLADAEAHPGVGTSWEEVRGRLLGTE